MHLQKEPVKMIGASCKNQFSMSQLSLYHSTPITFVTSQWQKDKNVPNCKYLAYRVCFALLFLITWIISLCQMKNNTSAAFWAKWFIYLTDWGYTVCTLQALFAAGMLACVLAARFYSSSMPNLAEKALKLYKVYWITNTIGTAIAFGITAMYWSVIYNPEVMQFDVMNYFVHGNNSILMMIDLFVVNHPLQILHFLYPVSFGVVYALFSLIYFFAGGTSREGCTYIYTILDWNKPGTTIVICLGVMAFLILLHLFNWSIHKLRIKLYEHITTPTSSNDSQNKSDSMAGYDNEGMATIVVET